MSHVSIAEGYRKVELADRDRSSTVLSQVLALVSLKPNHLTLSGAVLDQLAAAQAPDEAESADSKPHHPDVDLKADPTSADANSTATGEDLTRTAGRKTQL